MEQRGTILIEGKNFRPMHAMSVFFFFSCTSHFSLYIRKLDIAVGLGVTNRDKYSGTVENILI